MLASLADLKRHLNITSAANDDELYLMLDAAERVVAATTGERSGATVTESVPVVAGTAILSRRPSGPVLTGGVPVGGYVDSAAGVITDLVGYNYWPNQRLTVTYTAGGGTAPPEVALATLIIAAHLWETQRGVSPTALQQLDASQAFTPGSSYAIPNRAQELLQPYVRPAIA